MFDWITGFVDSVGLFGIAVLMFVENVFPPIPSELIMPLAGFNAAKGEQSLVLVIVAGSIGSLAGALLWYWIGRKVGSDRLKRLAARHGRWLTIAPDDIDSSNRWFRKRRGGAAVFVGRLIPTIRTFISVPAGVARMPLPWFIALSSLGTAIWTSILAFAGFVLESQYEKVQAWLNPASTVIVVLIVGFYLYRVVRYDPAPKEEPTEDPDRESGPGSAPSPRR